MSRVWEELERRIREEYKKQSRGKRKIPMRWETVEIKIREERYRDKWEEKE